MATISVGHLYNLRKRAGYLDRRRIFTKTQPTTIAIGARRAPAPDGRPGFIRIDSVHQGDQDGVKGVYHINAVVCVTDHHKRAAAPGEGKPPAAMICAGVGC